MDNLQKQVAKVLKENKVNLSSEELLLGIYEELSNLTRQSLAKSGKVSSNPTRSMEESLGELTALLMEYASKNSVSLEEALKNYLENIS